LIDANHLNVSVCDYRRGSERGTERITNNGSGGRFAAGGPEPTDGADKFVVPVASQLPGRIQDGRHGLCIDNTVDKTKDGKMAGKVGRTFVQGETWTEAGGGRGCQAALMVTAMRMAAGGTTTAHHQSPAYLLGTNVLNSQPLNELRRRSELAGACQAETGTAQCFGYDMAHRRRFI
jgi:hypothetical protein